MIRLIVLLCLFSLPAHAINEYLNDSGNHCSSGSAEPYIELRKGQTGNNYPHSYTNNYDGESEDYAVGFRFRFQLGSSCTKEYKKMMQQNMNLKQELELLKLCSRYRDLDLGPNFNTVREKCKDVRKRQADTEE
jgi:hypothetical protein